MFYGLCVEKRQYRSHDELFCVVVSKRFFLCACTDGDSAAGGTGTQGAILGKPDKAL
jgi:hypothetical protein